MLCVSRQCTVLFHTHTHTVISATTQLAADTVMCLWASLSQFGNYWNCSVIRRTSFVTLSFWNVSRCSVLSQPCSDWPVYLNWTAGNLWHFLKFLFLKKCKVPQLNGHCCVWKCWVSCWHVGGSWFISFLLLNPVVCCFWCRISTKSLCGLLLCWPQMKGQVQSDSSSSAGLHMHKSIML